MPTVVVELEEPPRPPRRLNRPNVIVLVRVAPSAKEGHVSPCDVMQRRGTQGGRETERDTEERTHDPSVDVRQLRPPKQVPEPTHGSARLDWTDRQTDSIQGSCRSAGRVGRVGRVSLWGVCACEEGWLAVWVEGGKTGRGRTGRKTWPRLTWTRLDSA